MIRSHRPQSVVIAGAGVAGLSAALALSRSGIRVTIVERDAVAELSWTRAGVPHFSQPHILLPRGRQALLRRFPDVYAALLRMGALEIDPARKLLGECRPGDEELLALAVRRPLLESALRAAVLAEPEIRVISGQKITGLAGRAGSVPRIEGLRTAAGDMIGGDLVVDALGRTSPVPAWIEALGGRPPQVESFPCGFVYYSRHFRLRPDVDLPDGPWLFGPRGKIGPMTFLMFYGDNRTFAISFCVPTGVRDLRVIRHEAAFMAACRAVPVLREAADPRSAEPISPVMPLGSLQNTFRHYQQDGGPCALGTLPIGDAICHTDPSFSLGLSFALDHAGKLADAITGNPGDGLAQARAYFAAIEPEARERFLMIRNIYAARERKRQGEPLDFTKRSSCYPLFASMGLDAAALMDAEIFRVAVRRFGLLDRLSVFDNDIRLQDRVEELLKDGMEQSPAAA
ncbi:MAG: hypothetical protein C5B51_07000 [Terriglobia bacterium]|nr:MAG: hypothetical protein C5B51_07000 [Terriglobia bacterium]